MISSPHYRRQGASTVYASAPSTSLSSPFCRTSHGARYSRSACADRCHGREAGMRRLPWRRIPVSLVFAPRSTTSARERMRGVRGGENNEKAKVIPWTGGIVIFLVDFRYGYNVHPYSRAKWRIRTVALLCSLFFCYVPRRWRQLERNRKRLDVKGSPGLPRKTEE